MSRALRIAVMYGGPSAEREVSLRSGAAVCRALRSHGHQVTALDPRADDWTLPPGTELVFLVLHGTYGEDGSVQQRLDRLGVPYTGCGAEASRIAFDKLETKRRCLAAGVPTPRFTVVDSRQASFPLGWVPPVVVKPLRQGSSVGLRFVDRVEEWRAALAETLQHDHEALVEERILGRETTVGILGSEAHLHHKNRIMVTDRHTGAGTLLARSCQGLAVWLDLAHLLSFELLQFLLGLVSFFFPALTTSAQITLPVSPSSALFFVFG